MHKGTGPGPEEMEKHELGAILHWSQPGMKLRQENKGKSKKWRGAGVETEGLDWGCSLSSPRNCHIAASVACNTSTHSPPPAGAFSPSGSCHCGLALLLGQSGVVTSRDDSAQGARLCHSSLTANSPISAHLITHRGRMGLVISQASPSSKSGNVTQTLPRDLDLQVGAGNNSLLLDSQDPPDPDRNKYARPGLQDGAGQESHAENATGTGIHFPFHLFCCARE